MKERPERLKTRRREVTEAEEENMEWWELPNIRADPAAGQDAQGSQVAGAGEGPEQVVEAGQSEQVPQPTRQKEEAASRQEEGQGEERAPVPA